MARSYPDSWYSVIDRALPARQLAGRRDALINAIAVHIRRWKALQPEIAPYAEKLRELTVITDKIKDAMEEAAKRLHDLGVAEDIERIKAENAALGIDPPESALRGRTAALDLYLVAWRAIDGLRTWDRLYRKRKGRPREFSTALATEIAGVCKQGGLSKNETENVLSRLSGADGLPKLTAATLKKREQRARRAAGTK